MQGVQRTGWNVIVVEKHIAFITSSHCWKKEKTLHNKFLIKNNNHETF